MPRIPASIEESSFFLYGTNPKTGENIGPGGTGFVVTRITKEADISTYHHYAVTNWHVVFGEGGYSKIRLNRYDSDAKTLEYEPHEWQFIKKYDLAAIDITDVINIGEYEVMSITGISENDFINKDNSNKYGIQMGDDVIMIGYFAGSPGDKRNLPAARFGNISRMADENTPIAMENIGELPCHMVDMRSRPGFSGSPVFVYSTPASDFNTIIKTPDGETILPRDLSKIFNKSNESKEKKDEDKKWVLTVKDNLFFKLLGIHSSQFQDHITIKIDGKTVKERKGEIIKEGDNLVIPSSMTIVIPAERITELLDLDYFEEIRKKREAENKETSK